MSSGRFSVPEGMIIADDGRGRGESVHNSAVAKQNAYSTSFPNNELPFGGSGWAHGFSDGTLWNNIRTTPGKAFGTQNGIGANQNFRDGIAHLGGTWFNDQTATATVFATNLVTSGDATQVVEEVELLLRFAITQGRAIGYECTFAVNPNLAGGHYVQINRWDGVLGGFILLKTVSQAVANGDSLFASIIGTALTLKVNGATVLTYDTSTGNNGGSPGSPDSIQYATGAPGIGHYFTVATPVGTYFASDYGLSTYSITAA